MVDAGGRTKPVVMARGLRKLFPDKVALHTASFDLAEGDVLGLIGANGGGKTTTLRMIAGLLKPDEGELTVLGHYLPADATKIRSNIGYVSQRLSLYEDLTVLENLRFFARAYNVTNLPETISTICDQFSLGPVCHKRIAQLSGGWARVVQLAAGMMHNPQLLLLDEPTAGLDAAMKAFIWYHIRQYAQNGRAVVVSTHDLDEAPRCDQLLYFSEGKIPFRGTPSHITEQSHAVTVHLSGENLEGLVALLSDKKWCYSVTHEMNGLNVVLAATQKEELENLASNANAELILAQHSLADACLAQLTLDKR